MATELFLAILGASVLVSAGLHANGTHWFKAWLAGSLFVPVALFFLETLHPSLSLGDSIVFGTLYGIGLAGLGLVFGWLIARSKRNDPAS